MVQEKGRVFAQVKTSNLKELPIPNTSNVQDGFVEKIDKILSLKEQNIESEAHKLEKNRPKGL
jgi:hypothetical protein